VGAQASPARVAEKAAGQPVGAVRTAAQNPEAGAGGEIEQDAQWRPVLGLPCDLFVDLPLPAFRIADLLKMRPGSVIDAHWRVGQDVPLRLNGTLLGWIEFEVMGNSLAVRLTELA
jgi:flagellar motor switch/type III secretory pathway protein FliN